LTIFFGEHVESTILIFNIYLLGKEFRFEFVEDKTGFVPITFTFGD
jgi:hypothetical protein